MIAAISQPPFIPYGGYFSLINNVDHFIFLDDVQFDKRSWQQRNFIRISGNPQLITIPVITKGKLNQKINEVQIDYKNLDVAKILRTIELNYKKKDFFEEFFLQLKSIFLKKHKFLCELNIDIIEAICFYLDIKTKKYLSSNFKNSDDYTKIELLKYLLKQLKCNQYYTTLGAKDYLGKMNFFSNTKIQIKYFNFEDKDKFLQDKEKKRYAFFSVIDSIFKHGKKTKNFLDKNFKILD